MDPPTTGDDFDWNHWQSMWDLQPAVTYLNHGGVGPSPRPVIESLFRWIRRIEAQPHAFFARTAHDAVDAARKRLAAFVGAGTDDLVFMTNTNMAAHAVAAGFALAGGDEVVFTDHEYGTIRRIWERACRRRGARLVVRPLDVPMSSADAVVDQLFEAVGPHTRLIVVSHISSDSALILPVEAICRRAHDSGVQVLIDGAHALAQLPLNLSALGCDYYIASCHKWLSAPFGSGLLYVHPSRQASIDPLVVDWGTSWRNVAWAGTRDFAPYLATADAIDFLEAVPVESFRRRTHELARYARRRITELTQLEPFTPDDATWYGSMTTLPLPAGDADALRDALCQRHGIDVAVRAWHDRRIIRVSCHLYNTPGQIDRLADALTALLGAER